MGATDVAGWVRLPEITVPLGSFTTSIKEYSLAGWEVLFMRERLRQIYGSREAYLRRFAATTDDMGAQRYIVTQQGERMKADAAADAPTF